MDFSALMNDGDKLISFARKLQDALSSKQLLSYCTEQAEKAKCEDLRRLWTFVAAQSTNCSKIKFLELLNKENGTGIYGIKTEIGTYAATYGYNLDIEEDRVNNDTVNLLASTDEETLLNSLCYGNLQQAVVGALSRKQFALALLIAKNSSNNKVVRYVALLIQNEESCSTVLRISALITAGMWNELITLWDLNDWKRLFSLILAQAPSSKYQRLCGDLANRLITERNSFNAAFPAVVAGDIETVVKATGEYANEERFALAAILNQSFDSASCRTFVPGIHYQNVLFAFTKQLRDLNQNDLAWGFLDMMPTNDYSEDGLHVTFNEEASRIQSHLSSVEGKNTSDLKNGTPFAVLATNACIGSALSEESLENCSSFSSAPSPISVFISADMTASSTIPSPVENLNLIASDTYSSQLSHTTTETDGTFSSQARNTTSPPGNLVVVGGTNGFKATDMLRSKLRVFVPDASNPSFWNRSSLTTQFMPSVAASHLISTNIPVDVLLSYSDKHFVDSLRLLLLEVRKQTKETMILRKLENVEQKITMELIPRLAGHKFSEATLSRLYKLGNYLIGGDYRRCYLIIGELVHGFNFGELSTFLPALSTLVSCAEESGIRRHQRILEYKK